LLSLLHGADASHRIASATPFDAPMQSTNTPARPPFGG